MKFRGLGFTFQGLGLRAKIEIFKVYVEDTFIAASVPPLRVTLGSGKGAPPRDERASITDSESVTITCVRAKREHLEKF